MKTDILIAFIVEILVRLIKTLERNIVIILMVVAVAFLLIDFEYLYDVEKAENGHFYEVVTIEKNWKEAKKECEKLGGHLVTIDDSKEAEIVSNLIRSDICWLGAEKIGPEWRWVTGEVVNFFAWAQEEPNNIGGIEDAIVMNLDGTWNDANKSQPYADAKKLYYICEWEHKLNFIINLKNNYWTFGLF